MGKTTGRVLLITILVLCAALISPGGLTGVGADEGSFDEYVTHTIIRVNNDAQLAAAATSGHGTAADPYVIEGLDIAGSSGICIYVGNTTSYLIIRDCTLHGASDTVYIYGQGAGITLYNARNVVIANNNCSGNNIGVFLYRSDGITVADNLCDGNGNMGIDMQICNSGSVTNNTFTGGRWGIYMVSSSSNKVEGNNASHNWIYGMYVYSSNSNTIANNSFFSNTQYGVYVDSVGTSYYTSKNNLIYGNVLENNNGAGSVYSSSHIQAYDNGVNYNKWNSSSYGNYWRDWTAPDADKNGFVDSYYVIYGGTQNDSLPVAMSLDIESPGSGHLTNSSTVTVSGTAADGFGIASIVWSNAATGSVGSCVGTSSWTARVGLSEGENNITVAMYDERGSRLSESIVVLYSSGAAIRVTPISPIYTNQDSIDLLVNVTDVAPITDVLIQRYLDGALVDSDGSDVYNGMTSFESAVSPSLEQGVNIIRITVNDTAGNMAWSSTTVYCDLDGPMVSIISPGEGARVNTANVTIHWTASESTSGIAYYLLGVDDAGTVQLSASISSHEIIGLSDGAHDVVLTAINNAGDRSSSSLRFVVDTVAPTATVSPVGEDVPLSSTIAVTFSEAMDGTSTTIVINGVDGLVSWDHNVATFVPSSHLEFNGNYSVMITAEDLAGNELEMRWTFSTPRVGNIEGRVVDREGIALDNATVSLSSGASVVTDSDGHFWFENVSAGTYSITIMKNGYENVTASVVVNGNETTEMTTLNAASEVGSAGADTTVFIVAAVTLTAALGAIGFLLYRRGSRGQT